MAIDALVALTLLSMTLALSIGALSVAHRAAARAAELQRAATVLRYALDTAPPGPVEVVGHDDLFDWRVTTELQGASAGLPVLQACRRRAEVHARRSGRIYRLATVEICPARMGA